MLLYGIDIVGHYLPNMFILWKDDTHGDGEGQQPWWSWEEMLEDPATYGFALGTLLPPQLSSMSPQGLSRVSYLPPLLPKP